MRIRQFLISGLALLIMVAQMGVALHVHYCAGEVASVKTVFGFTELATQMEETCCGTEATPLEKMSCCKDKKFKFKDTAEKLLVKDITPELLALEGNSTFYLASFLPKPTVHKQPILAYYCDAHGPPLYARYSQRLFYA